MIFLRAPKLKRWRALRSEVRTGCSRLRSGNRESAFSSRLGFFTKVVAMFQSASVLTAAAVMPTMGMHTLAH